MTWARIPFFFGVGLCNMKSVPSIFLQGEGWLFCALVVFSSILPSLTSPSSHQFHQYGGCQLPYAAMQRLMTGFSRFASLVTDLHRAAAANRGSSCLFSGTHFLYTATPWCIFFIVILFGFLSNFNFVLELFYLLLRVRDCSAIFIDRRKLFTSMYIKEEGHSKKHIFLSLPIKTSY